MGYRVKAVHPLDELSDVLVVFEIPRGRTIPEAIAEIEAALPEVTAGAHHLYRLQVQTTQAAGRSYANALIRWPESGCRPVRKVGLVDAGVLPSHPGLTDGRIVQERFVPGSNPPATDHGSLMADLLIGTGRLAGATLYSANVVDPIRDGGDAAGVVAILQAVDWLASEDVDIVNISLAGPDNKLMRRALGTSARDNMVFVAAAGNQGPGAPPQYPAALPFALAVTAIDSSSQVYRRAVQGDYIDVAAPGVDILIESEGRLRAISGTSAAAPYVTAALAADPNFRQSQATGIRARLPSQTVDLGIPGKDSVFGTGMILAPTSCRIE